jgi:hypothetical protein
MIAFASNRAGDENIFVDGSDVHVLVGGVWTSRDPRLAPLRPRSL